MAKKVNKGVPGKKKGDQPMNAAMKIFLAGCVAELYLLVVRRFYVAGSIYQLVAWDAALKYIMYAGAVLAVVGLALGLAFMKKPGWQRLLGWCLLAAGLFLAVSNWITRTVYPTGSTLLCILVPAAMLLGVLWNLYDRECFYALSIQGVTLVVLWICRRGVGNAHWNSRVMVGGAVFIVLMAALILLAVRLRSTGGKLGSLRIMPSNAVYTPVVATCGLAIVVTAAALFSTSLAYYAMWAVAIVMFIMAVYYTVKQL